MCAATQLPRLPARTPDSTAHPQASPKKGAERLPRPFDRSGPFTMPFDPRIQGHSMLRDLSYRMSSRTLHKSAAEAIKIDPWGQAPGRRVSLPGRRVEALGSFRVKLTGTKSSSRREGTEHGTPRLASYDSFFLRCRAGALDRGNLRADWARSVAFDDRSMRFWPSSRAAVCVSGLTNVVDESMKIRRRQPAGSNNKQQKPCDGGGKL